MRSNGSTFSGVRVVAVDERKTKEKVCDRCGLVTSRNVGRTRSDGLSLCKDCKSDKWLIKKFTA
jgi:hypothetical protein